MLPLIEYRNVTVTREHRVVLDKINLSIGLGEHVAILGPNGCGKSTLIKTITRELYPQPEPGTSMTILGKEIWNIFDLRPLIGIVSQDWLQYCTTNYTSFEIVLSGFFGSVGIWPNHTVTPAMESKVRELMETLEISHLADRFTDELSSGEARRVLIGRALVHEPKALVLDEPSNSLDMKACHELRQTMRRLAQAGIGIILVTHHLPDIIPEIQRAVLMSKGRIVGDGPIGETLTVPRLSQLFEVDIISIIGSDIRYSQ